MIRVSNISHPNPIIEEKMKYFEDTFHYILSKNGDRIKFPLENHLTILERIKTRLDKFNIKKTTKELIGCYIKDHKLFKTNDNLYLKKNNNISQLVIKAKKSWSNPGIDISDFSKIIHQLIIEINGENGLDGDKYFTTTLKYLAEIMNHKSKNLKSHKNKINQLIHILATEYLRVGYLPSDLSHYRIGIFSRILSNEIEIYEDPNNFYSKFPLPERIEKLRNTDEFKKSVESFLANRNFTEQLEGLYSIFKKKISGKFIIRIDGISSSYDDINFEINNFKVLSVKNLNIDTQDWEDFRINELNDFIQNEHSIFLSYSTEFKSMDSGYRYMIKKATDVLNVLNFYFGNGGYLNKNDYYFFYDSGGTQSSWKRTKFSISKGMIKNVFKNRLIFNLPKKLNNSIKESIRISDRILFNASNNILFDEIIINYLRYIETIFTHHSLNKKKEIIKSPSKIITNSFLVYDCGRIITLISNLIDNSDKDSINLKISKPEFSGLRHKINQGDKSLIPKFNEIQDHYFINDLLDQYHNIEEYIDLKYVSSYYKQIFMELYEQRNALVHQGIYCESTINKLLDEIPNLIRRLRIMILKDIINDPSVESLEPIIQKLIDNTYTTNHP